MKILSLKSAILLGFLASSTALSLPQKAIAEVLISQRTVISTLDLNGAKNLARQAAEEANGGLGKYRAESSMHGNALDTPHVENADGSYTFTFKGRRPSSLDFTYESQVTVSADGTVVVNYNNDTLAVEAPADTTATSSPEPVDYYNNTPPSEIPASTTDTSTTEPVDYYNNTPPAEYPETTTAIPAVETTVNTTSGSLDLNQAKNLARQAAEEANGGLGNYRAEFSMHGFAQDSPYVENPDGSYTFSFKGRRPESLDFTYETVVTVYSEDDVRIDSNREF